MKDTYPDRSEKDPTRVFEKRPDSNKKVYQIPPFLFGDTIVHHTIYSNANNK